MAVELTSKHGCTRFGRSPLHCDTAMRLGGRAGVQVNNYPTVCAWARAQTTGTSRFEDHVLPPWIGHRIETLCSTFVDDRVLIWSLETWVRWAIRELDPGWPAT